jgi:hypothetical protein
MAGHEVLDFLLDLLLIPAVAFLEQALELRLLPGDFRKVVIRELVPLLFDFARNLLPATEMALHVLAYNLTRVLNIIAVRSLIAAMQR